MSTNSSLVKEYMPLLEPQEVKISKDQFNKLVYESNGNLYKDIKVFRTFPYSNKYQFIMLKRNEEELERDQKEEIGIIEDLSELDDRSQNILKEELDRKYFIPEITNIIDIVHRNRGTVWYVETDRGNMMIEMTRRSETTFTAPNHLVIKDAEGSKFEIPDCQKLDENSLQLIEREV